MCDSEYDGFLGLMTNGKFTRRLKAEAVRTAEAKKRYEATKKLIEASKKRIEAADRRIEELTGELAKVREAAEADMKNVVRSLSAYGISLEGIAAATGLAPAEACRLLES
jgi:hypothetical protein